jgi:large subunit ribosomal protein L24
MGAAAHVKKGDDVVITAGDFKGRTGKVVKVDRDRERVTVQGPNIDPIRKTLRPTRVNPQGGMTEIDRTFHMSNVSPSVGGKPTRVRFDVREDGSKRRVAVRDGSVLHELRGPRAK